MQNHQWFMCECAVNFALQILSAFQLPVQSSEDIQEDCELDGVLGRLRPDWSTWIFTASTAEPLASFDSRLG